MMVASPQVPSLTKYKADCQIFVLKDCPIANQYAPELQRIIKDYTPKGVQFTLIFEDPDVNLPKASEHARSFGYKIPMTTDANHQLAKRYGVTVSPSVVLQDMKKVYYVGRIDDTYPSIGKRRPKATKHDLRDALDAFLAGRSVKKTKTEAVGCRLY